MPILTILGLFLLMETGEKFPERILKEVVPQKLVFERENGVFSPQYQIIWVAENFPE